ncbi:hypothetical protein L6164_028600 [Bauhinia variegata]|uniref:Uncharacterized protein n=1 Tax=Bauhinia variegata TaxID=167791 RepID=A0ACB9L755_BAUVA|nr:hypothetical protein L6164_028600 [Bauhinia variegata]
MQKRITDPVSHSCCYMNEKKCLHYWKCNSNRRSSRSRLVKIFAFKIPGNFEFSTIELLKQVADRVTKALHLVSVRRSPLDSSSSGKSRPVGISVDSHRTAAVEDCIEFIHSSFSRSNSTTSYQDANL